MPIFGKFVVVSLHQGHVALEVQGGSTFKDGGQIQLPVSETALKELKKQPLVTHSIEMRVPLKSQDSSDIVGPKPAQSIGTRGSLPRGNKKKKTSSSFQRWTKLLAAFFLKSC